MALVFYHSVASKCCKFGSLLKRQKSRTFTVMKPPSNMKSTYTKVNSSVNEEKIIKSVFISQSHDIFTNLALEDWMYKNFDFTHHHVMLLWRNSPCVVIGRHQNPWMEANFIESENGIQLARRNSGGGTVYHDEGNLNVTFFTPRERYNRKQNLEILAKTLERGWDLHSQINKKEDIVLDSAFKISGTASKLGRPNSYHHCTLLVDVNKEQLVRALDKNKGLQFKTTATQSVPSPTLNLSEVNSNITMDGLMAAVGWEYLRTSAITQKDLGWELVSKQRGFQMINPTDEWFPGLDKIRSEFYSWEWRYGKTPKFVATKQYNLDNGLGQLSVSVEVEGGIVGGVVLSIPPGVAWGRLTGDVDLVTTARDQKFTPQVFDLIQAAIKQQGVSFQSARQEMAI